MEPSSLSKLCNTENLPSWMGMHLNQLHALVQNYDTLETKAVAFVPTLGILQELTTH